MILAGDIGGTKTLLGLFEGMEGGRPVRVASASLPSRDFPSFEKLLAEFLGRESLGEPPRCACLGVAGPVLANRCRTTNLPWLLDGAELAERFDMTGVELINDAVATAEGIATLAPGELVEILPGARPHDGARQAALLAVGTGLGMAVLAPGEDGSWRALASEGGHADFASRSEEEDALLRYLRGRHPEHVSIERAVAGPAFATLYRFLATRGVEGSPAVAATIEADEASAPVVISSHGLDHSCPRCVRTLELFASLLGATAGNLALTVMATGGVFLGGGVSPQILPALRGEAFRSAFLGKGRYRGLLTTIPVLVITEPETALRGAALRAGR